MNWSFREVSYRSCKPAAWERSRRFTDSGAGRPKLRPGGLIFHRFANGQLQCVRCAACVTIPLGVVADRRIGMPVGLDLASRSSIQLRKSWSWAFSCSGRYCILATIKISTRQLRLNWIWRGKQGTYWLLSRWYIFLCNRYPGVAFRFFSPPDWAASVRDRGIQYHDL